jgi:2-polyprenyl-6-methoxyphenol hydroxylase-like FAD-dependent oxidoreductase
MQETPGPRVIIVGGGPVGMGLAVTLAQRGVASLIVERSQPQPIPKGQNLTQRTMEHFHFWGLEKALRAARTIPPEFGIGGLTAYGSLLGEFSYDWLQRDLVRPYYFTDNERLPQYATEAVLRGRIAELPLVRTAYGCAAEAVGQDGDGAWVDLVDGEGRRRTERADYLVGCDGSRSIVREQAGISQTLSDHDRSMVLIVFRSKALDRLLQRFPGKSYFNILHPDLKGYWQFFGRVDLDGSWFFHAPVPPGTTRESLDAASLLHRAVGAEFDVETGYVGFWDLRFAVADSYRTGRIFIAGDAAHSHPPYGGYGINTGFEDAANLGWKLAAALQGWAGPGLLASYTEERLPVFASTARDFIEKAIREDRAFLEAFDPERDREAFLRRWTERQSAARKEVHAFEPNYEGSPIVWGPPGGVSSALGSHSLAARAGHHLTPFLLPSGRNVFEALGPGFTLLAKDAESPMAQAFAAAARELRAPLQLVATDQAELVLVRPDQFVAWTSKDDASNPRDVLARALGGVPALAGSTADLQRADARQR